MAILVLAIVCLTLFGASQPEFNAYKYKLSCILKNMMYVCLLSIEMLLTIFAFFD